MLMAATATPEAAMMRRRGRMSPSSSSSSPRRRSGGIGTQPNNITAATTTTPSKRCSPRLLLRTAASMSETRPSTDKDVPHNNPPTFSSLAHHSHREEESRGPTGEEHGQGIQIDGYSDVETRPVTGDGPRERERERERAAAPSPIPPQPPHPTPAEPDQAAAGAGTVTTTEISPEVGRDDGDDDDGPHNVEEAVVVARSVTIDVDSGGDEDVGGGGNLSSPEEEVVGGATTIVDRGDTKSSETNSQLSPDVEVVETGSVPPPPSSSLGRVGAAEDSTSTSEASATRPGVIREDHPPGSGEGVSGVLPATTMATISAVGAGDGATPHQSGTNAEGVPHAATATAATISAASATPHHQGALNDEELLKPPLSSLSEFSPLSFEEGMEVPVSVPGASSSSSCESALKCPGSSGSQGNRRGKRERRGVGSSSVQEHAVVGGSQNPMDVVTPVQLKISSPVEEAVESCGRKRGGLDGAANTDDNDPDVGSSDRHLTTTKTEIPAPAPVADIPQAGGRSRGGGVVRGDASDDSTVSNPNGGGAMPERHGGRGRGRGAAAIVGRGGRSRRDSRGEATQPSRRRSSSMTTTDRSPSDFLFTTTEAAGPGPMDSSPSCHHDRPVPAKDAGDGGGVSDDPLPAEDGGGEAATVGITRPQPRRGAPRSCAVAGGSATTKTVPKEDDVAKSKSSKRKRSVPSSTPEDNLGAEASSRSAGGGRDDEREVASRPSTNTSTSSRVQVLDTTWAKSTALSQGAELNAIQTILIELLRRVRRKCDRYGFFSRPVDPIQDGCPDYYDAVDRETEAMDLGTMETMIRDGRIAETHDFEVYLGRIVRCALRYNTDPDNFVRRQALELERLAQPMVDRSRRAVERLCQLRSGAVTDASAEQAVVATVAPPSAAAAAAAAAVEVAEPSSLSSISAETVSHGAATPASDEATPVVVTRDKKSETILTTTDRMSRHGSRDEEDGKGRCAIAAAATHDATTFDASVPGGDIPRCRRDLSTSVVTRCTSRDEWLSLCPEMLVVTNEAARRATLSVDPDADRYDKPLSETYMRERLDCHLPLHGYFVRAADPSKNADGGGAVRRRGRPPKKKKKLSSLGRPQPQHLQGFIVTSTFITWRRTFRWAVDDPRAGIIPSDRRARPCDDGTLTSDLQRQERRHDSVNDCFVFPRIAEITLLGGLGCGGSLVRRAMEDLERSRQYDLVVLQATKMAIPFYERMGFVRVGAVARFYDSGELPEVAYRHWSETTGKQAIEASYMMAARLNPPGGDRSTIPATLPDETSGTKTTTTKDEIDLSRRHALELIQACLPIHTGKAGGSFSYRELAGIAKRLASSVGDDDLADLIGRSLDVYRSNAPGNSKNILRGALDLPIFRHDIAETTLSEQKKFTADGPSTGGRPLRGGKLIRISRILVDGVPVSSGGDGRRGEDGDFLHAIVPANARRPRRNTVPNEACTTGRNCVKVSVVVLGSSPHSLGLCEADATLTAVIDRSDGDDGSESDHDNDKAMKEASRASLKNLRRGMKAMVHGFEPGADPIVAIGDKVMVQVEADENEDPSWQICRVLRRCKKYEIPEGGNADNSYVVRSSGGPKFGFAFVLDGCSGGGGMDRGIGRKWCTMCDWTGFPNLDHSVLDSLLIGASVHYVSAEGDRVVGVVSQRVRDSHGGCSKWRVERRSVSGEVAPKGSSCFVDLDPAELRECVRISDETMRRVANMVLSKDSFPQQKRKAAGMGSRKRKRSSISEEVEEERKYRGVYRAGSRWCAKICHEGRLLHLGTFDSQLAAFEAFQEAFKRIKGCAPE